MEAGEAFKLSAVDAEGSQLNKVAVPAAFKTTLVLLAQMLALFGLIVKVGSGFITTVCVAPAVQELAAVITTV